jgi:hypothetical protein
MSNNLLVWTDDRCKELEKLRSLLYLVSGLENGSGFLGKVQEAIDLADKLMFRDWNEKPGFYQFLHNLAIKNRTEFKGE